MADIISSAENIKKDVMTGSERAGSTAEDEKFKECDRILNTMEVVEKQLVREKNEASLIICLLLACTCVWTIFCEFWIYYERPIDKSDMTIGIECIGIAIMLIALKFTHFKLKDMGLNFNNISGVLKRAAVISVSIIAVMLIARKIMVSINSSLAFITPLKWYEYFAYILTAVLQEFLCRGVTQECLSRVLATRHSQAVAVIITSLFFATVHMFYGCWFMLAAGLLSLALGVLYLKDKNIWGLSLIHYTVGLAALMLFF